MKDSLSRISKEVMACTKCPLYKTACMGVPGEGPSDAKIMLIGQAPGATEDKTGRPFIGRSGKLLTQLLDSIGLPRDRIFITSIVKHFPPKNRPPTPLEVNACKEYVLRQIRLIDPKLILLVGRTSQSLLTEPILEGRQIMLMTHPAAALRFTKMRTRLLAEFDELRSLIQKL